MLPVMSRHDREIGEESQRVDHEMMRLALAQAQAAVAAGEVPVGAVVTRGDVVIAEAHNLRETLNDPTAHAERLALALAGSRLRTWRLEDCTLFVTLEPCAMCAGAIVLARIKRVVYGTDDPKAGACKTLYKLTEDPRLNHRAMVEGGVLKEECGLLLSQFFAARRKTAGHG
jgi:tRNA(adenine34) deaminase